MKWKPHEVAEIFNLRDFMKLCSLVDGEDGKMVKFDIQGIRSGEDGKQVITVVLDGGKKRAINL